MFGIGYLTLQGERLWQPPKILVSVIFTLVMAWNLLREPERSTSRANLIIIALLLAGLNVWTALDTRLGSMVWISTWSALFGGACFAHAWIYRKEQGIRL